MIEWGVMKAFYNLLANNLIANVTNYTVWFAITFYVYLETKSVLATAFISGIYLVAASLSGFWFGSIVDHNRKKNVMLYSSFFSLIIYVISFAIYISAPQGEFRNPASPLLWVFVLFLLAGIVAGNLRTIALPTLVTILIDRDKRDRANGMTGTAFGISFLITSVISGVLVGASGMFGVLLLAIIATIAVIVYLIFIRVDERKIVHLPTASGRIDIKGTLKVVRGVPGLPALILFSSINNLLGGVFMALMDAYGLSLVSVEIWGFLWGALSTGFIIGGLIIAKRGLGRNPVKSLFAANIIIWIIACFFTIQQSIILLAVGNFIYLIVMPYIEASEQTILQKVVPLERQGRVFGFAQSVEQAASPLTAFFIGPIAQFVFIPFMTNGIGADVIGDFFGRGPDRGIALVFTATGITGLIITLYAMRTKYYGMLSRRYLSEK